MALQSLLVPPAPLTLQSQSLLVPPAPEGCALAGAFCARRVEQKCPSPPPHVHPTRRLFAFCSHLGRSTQEGLSGTPSTGNGRDGSVNPVMMALRWVKHFRTGRRGLVVWSSPNCRRIVVYFPDAHEYNWRWATGFVEAEVVPLH